MMQGFLYPTFLNETRINTNGSNGSPEKPKKNIEFATGFLAYFAANGYKYN